MALINKLENLGDAIREKTGTTELLTLDEMATAVSSIPAGLTAEDLTFSGELSDYTLSGSFGETVVKKYKDLISFNNISEAPFLFNDNTEDLDGMTININRFKLANFMNGYGGTQLPKLVGSVTGDMSGANQYSQYWLANMRNIREIPKSFYEDIVWTKNDKVGMYSVFNSCYSLRTYPKEFIDSIPNFSTNSTYAGYNYVFAYCQSLEEVIDYPINAQTAFTSNIMSSFCDTCYRIKNITFKTNEDGSPIVAQWKGQTLELSKHIGYTPVGYSAQFLNYNSGITADKEIKDDATYQALKNDPDAWVHDIAYSRYNHDSAVNTINSLPDTSAYLATAGGTNTIKFKGAAGSATDGGAINTLTEEEIAVATARGWTVTLV